MRYHHHVLDHISLNASAVTIGSFDGVHLGHQLIINRLVEYSGARKIPSVVVTFFPHPFVVLRQIEEPFYLTFPEQRASIMHRLGVDRVVTLEFTKDLSKNTPEQFMNRLMKYLNFEYLCVGSDFALGKERKGNPETLKSIGKAMGYQMEIIPPVVNDGEKISSSRIRKLIHNGEIRKANKLLGRAFTICSKIKREQPNDTSDNGLAKISIETEPMQIRPAPGIYASQVWLGHKTQPAIIKTSTNDILLISEPYPSGFLVKRLEEKQIISTVNEVRIDFLYKIDSLEENQNELLNSAGLKHELHAIHEVMQNEQQT